ncbi:MAG: MFS transporter [Betaproteobacteria bacterium]
MNFPYALRALRHQNFRRYYVGQAISQIGSWMQSVAIMWLTYRLSGSTGATGTVGFLAMIPYLFVTPIAGALSDRVSRKKLLMVVQSVLFVHATLLALLTWQGHMTVPLLGIFALVQGVFSAVEVTTRHSFFAQLIEHKQDLPNAIALNSANINSTRLLGPAVGGLVIATAGEAACFGFNAISYLAVVFQLRRITPREIQRIPSGKSLAGDLAEGWKIALSSPVTLPLVLIVGLVSFCINPYSILMPAIAVETFGKGAELHGLFVSAVGIGALAGAVILASRPSVRGFAKGIFFTSACAAFGAISFALAAPYRSVPLSMAAMAFVGFGVMGTSASVNTIIQTVTDDDKRGRVVSVYSTFFTGAVPLGHLSAGWLAQQVGAPRAYLCFGILCAVGAVAYAINLPRLRSHLRDIYLARGIMTADEMPPDK